LGGARSYDGIIHELPAFGDGRSNLTASDILKSLELYWVSLNLLLVATIATALILWRFA
jgi:adenosylcobinamide-phosphate synthase